jgi:acylphosphatase
VTKTIKINVTGKVQGVGFRHFTKQQADLLGITGSIKNQPDGTVQIIAQSSPDKLKKFINKCYDGPHNSFVSDLKFSEIESTTKYPSFEIIH